MEVDLTVLSYNIHHGEGRDGVIDLQRLAAVIHSEKPDVAALQEVDRYNTRSGNVDQVAELACLTGMEAVFSVSIDAGNDGQYGNAVLSHLPILRTRTYPLPGEPRSLLETQIDLSGAGSGPESLMFYATHLDLEQLPRLQSVQRIRKVVTSFPGRSVILAGDLNAIPGSPTIQRMLEFMQHTTRAEQLVTITGPNGENPKQIDYIMFRPLHRWRVLDSKVLDEPVASDHYPLLSRLRMM